jgi:hypothetical protein
MADLAIPFFAVLLICTGMWIFTGLFYGDDIIQDHYDGIAEPTGILSTLDFIWDLLSGTAGLIFDVITVDVPGAPLGFSIMLTLCTAVLAIGIVSLGVSLL